MPGLSVGGVFEEQIRYISRIAAKGIRDPDRTSLPTGDLIQGESIYFPGVVAGSASVVPGNAAVVAGLDLFSVGEASVAPAAVRAACKTDHQKKQWDFSLHGPMLEQASGRVNPDSGGPGRFVVVCELMKKTLATIFALVVCAGCSSGVVDECLDGVTVGDECMPQDCVDRDCAEGFFCAGGVCKEAACIDVDCPGGQKCAGGTCYPEDCVWRNCPGLGEVCIDEECVPASCVDIDCPQGQRCAAGMCWPVDCDAKACPGYGEVCIEEECVDRTCVGVDCSPGEQCVNGFCYPESCGGQICADGEVCYQEQCVHEECLGLNCPAGERCVNGVCVSVDCPEACTYANQCQTAMCGGEEYTCLYDATARTPAWMQSGGCSDGDPCTGEDTCSQNTCEGTPIVCDNPPADTCQGDTRVAYPSQGTCQNGSCEYIPFTEECPLGCSNGVCAGDPCGGITCDSGEQCIGGACLCGGTGPDCTGSDSCCGTSCVDTSTDDANCGACGNSCGQNAGCNSSSCQCIAGFDNCDLNWGNGCENSLDSLSDCGSCGNTCDYDNATESCATGTCEFVDCEADWVNADGNLNNGCECQITDPNDPPGDGIDTNCDGIDGDASRVIFVAFQGDNQNPGSATHPKATIQAGIDTAAGTAGKDRVYVSEGTYVEKVTLANGISVYGSYSFQRNWERDASYLTQILVADVSGGKMIGVEGSFLLAATTFNSITVETTGSSQAGVSSYAFYCITCPGLSIENCVLRAGNAGPGTGGSDGTTGAAGSPGSRGEDGACDSQSNWGDGGDGGTSSCGRAGGNGGRGGSETDDGTNGLTGAGGTPGGSGGSGGDPGQNGTDGTAGTAGSAGSDGNGGSGGSLAGGYWQSDSGGDGAVGNPGNGGGGGGGGGGQGGLLVIDGGGGGGGGGGAGGCAGGLATGGSGGGGSFGLLLIDSTGVALEGNIIESGDGGVGGPGGTGGSGGTGGARGDRGTADCSGEVGYGGYGGRGGDGGRGGHGGGAAGGPSYGVYLDSTSVDLGSNTISFGSGGSGGSSPGNNGATGAAAQTN